jgi:hypothetical protein
MPGNPLEIQESLFCWHDALVVQQPATMIRWHRAGWKLFWRMKSPAGRSPIPMELRELICRMARENVLWDEERIAVDLLLKQGVRISSRIVRKYLPKRSSRPTLAATCALVRAYLAPIDLEVHPSRFVQIPREGQVHPDPMRCACVCRIVQSRHSSRIVPITRSQIASAMGLENGERSKVSTPSLGGAGAPRWNTGSCTE